jgi:molybdopterin molybdotransferase
MKSTGYSGEVSYSGFDEALALVLENTFPAGTVVLPLGECPGYVCAEDVCARTDSPSGRTSLKDGYAVRAGDIENVSAEKPAELVPVGSAFAGGAFSGSVAAGQAVKIFTGALIPDGADAVVAAEFCEENAGKVRVSEGIEPGRNIMPAGEDVAAGMKVAVRGDLLLPAKLAFMAAAGISGVEVYRKPRCTMISTGDEVVAPGGKLRAGQVYASNAVYAGAWLSLMATPYMTTIIPDDSAVIKETLTGLLPETDVFITSGGAMLSERDLVTDVLDDLGWEMNFRQVRMRPGKGTAFGLWQGKPVFCLPGGPAGNITAFVTLVLTGIRRMTGLSGNTSVRNKARLAHDIDTGNAEWTEFKQARLETAGNGVLYAVPLSGTSRMRTMAEADCLVCRPEGTASMHRDDEVTVYLLAPALNR